MKRYSIILQQELSSKDNPKYNNMEDDDNHGRNYKNGTSRNHWSERRRKSILRWNKLHLSSVMIMLLFLLSIHTTMVASFTLLHQQQTHFKNTHTYTTKPFSTSIFHPKQTSKFRLNCIPHSGSCNSNYNYSRDRRMDVNPSPLRIQHKTKLGRTISNSILSIQQQQQQQQQQGLGRKGASNMHMVMSVPDTTDIDFKEGRKKGNETQEQEREQKQSNPTNMKPKTSSSTSPSSASSSKDTKKTETSSTITATNTDTDANNTIKPNESINNQNVNRRRRKKKYNRKRPKSQSEKERDTLKQMRQKQYEKVMAKEKNRSNVWAFETLFPAPGWDDETIHRDLYEVAERDASIGGSSTGGGSNSSSSSSSSNNINGKETSSSSSSKKFDNALSKTSREIIGPPNIGANNTSSTNPNTNSTKVDLSLTRMVEDRLYGFRRGQMGEFEYDTSLMGDGAVKFRDGVRLGNALKVNADRLTHFAKRELIHGKLEEAEELYEQAIQVSPLDGRGYLGLAKIAERRRDFKSARDCLRAGIAKSRYEGSTNGANPFLLQALGNLEERMGHLSEAENLYIDAAKSRPAHAAAWVSLAQLRTRKLRQGPNAGRVCYQTAETELKKAGLRQSSYVYTAWAGLECKAGDYRRARELFQKALEVDPKCSAAWNQLGVMEADQENWDRAKECFETVLKFDKRNSRVLQAYALMETKRPDGNSREAIDLFEKAMRANPRDGGVFQAYGLYVAKLGDIDSARDLLRRGTETDKRHAPLWQAWGVLETRHGSASDAREVFQHGIWACAQSSGGQSGGRRCARLWQAWGVLEAQEGDYAAARRCFSRALDADNRNVATVTAWTLMEQELGLYNDAKLIFERSLRQFTSFSDEKLALWRAYELMEVEAGNTRAAQNVYQRSIRDSMGGNIESSISYDSKNIIENPVIESPSKELLKKSNEVEVSRWNSRDSFGESDVWLKDGSIEGKVPSSAMKKGKKSKQSK